MRIREQSRQISTSHWQVLSSFGTNRLRFVWETGRDIGYKEKWLASWINLSSALRESLAPDGHHLLSFHLHFAASSFSIQNENSKTSSSNSSSSIRAVRGSNFEPFKLKVSVAVSTEEFNTVGPQRLGTNGESRNSAEGPHEQCSLKFSNLKSTLNRASRLLVRAFSDPYRKLILSWLSNCFNLWEKLSQRASSTEIQKILKSFETISDYADRVSCNKHCLSSVELTC